MEPTERVEIGASGVSVTRLGVGLAALIGHGGTVDDATADAILTQARQLGIRYIDVSALYGNGRSEAATRRLLDDGATDFAVSTKAGRLLRPRTIRNRIRVRIDELRVAPDRGRLIRDYARFGADRIRSTFRRPGPHGVDEPPPSRWVVRTDLSASGVRRSAAESLERLGRDRTEILLLHDPDRLGPAALRSAWATMRELRSSGAARAVGISSNDAAALARMIDACDVDVVLLAGRYTLMDQSALDALMPVVLERDIPLVLGGVFNGGLLADPASGRFDQSPATDEQAGRAARIARTCRRHGISPVAAAIQFPAAHPAVASVLVGVRSGSELATDVSEARAPIPSEFWSDLARDGLIRSDAPVPTDGLADVAVS